MPAPSAPANLTATPDTTAGRKIDLAWDAAATATSYKVYHATGTNVEASDLTFTLLTTVTAPTVTYSHTALLNGITHWYKVTAVNGSGESAASNVAAQTARATPETYKWEVVRTITGDPANLADFDTKFDRANYAATTIDGLPALADDGTNLGTIVSKATDLKNFIITRIIKRGSTDGTWRLFAVPYLRFKQYDATHFFTIRSGFGGDTTELSQDSGFAAVFTSASNFPAASTDHWYEKTVVIGDLIRVRMWKTTDPEPLTWDIFNRYVNAGGATAEHVLAASAVQIRNENIFANGQTPAPVFFFQIEELARKDTNSYHDNDFSINDNPLLYFGNGPGEPWSTSEVVTGPDGKSQRCLKITDESLTATIQPDWFQIVYRDGLAQFLTSSIAVNRVLVSTWAKGSVTWSGPTNTAIIGLNGQHRYGTEGGFSVDTNPPAKVGSKRYWRSIGPRIDNPPQDTAGGYDETFDWRLHEWEVDCQPGDFYRNATEYVGTFHSTGELAGTVWLWKPRVTPIRKPTAVNAAGMAGKVRITATAPLDCTSCKVYRSTSSGGQGDTGDAGTPLVSDLVPTGTSLTYDDTTATPGTTYFYTVTTTFSASESEMSGEASGVASAGGSALSVSPASVEKGSTANTLTLTGTATAWTPGTPGSPTFTASAGTITAQTITSGAAATLTYNAPAAVVTVTITDPANATTDTVDVVDTTAPAAPTGLSTSSPASYNFTLAWTASVSGDVISYRIKKNGSVIATPSGTTQAITAAVDGDVFTAEAFDGVNYSAAASMTFHPPTGTGLMAPSTITINDPQGNPVPNAEVFIAFQKGVTDAAGQCVIDVVDGAINYVSISFPDNETGTIGDPFTAVAD